MSIQQASGKNEQIKELFKKDFAIGEWGENGERKVAREFTCSCQDSCKVEKDSPKHSSWLGDEDTKIMLVGEAPSNQGKGKCYFSGNFSKYIIDNPKGNKNFRILYDFFSNNDEGNSRPVPYFTDLMKCGVPKQKDKKGLSKQRITNCTAKFLKKEIEIIKPEKVYCIGKTAYNEVKKLGLEKNIEIIYLLHYSGQGNLQIPIDDKKMIWKIQMGELKDKDAENAILRLKFIQNLINGEAHT
jgi:hypothetical protein